MAALALTVGACTPEKKGGEEINWDDVTVDGFYVAGAATGSDEIKSDCVMVTGINEAATPKAPREGMYEKYIVLEADKDFYLLLNEAGVKTRYSANLAEFTTPTDNEAYGDNPASVLKGALVTGNDAPAMKVTKTGLYHIVLDLNKTGDLDAAGGAQILLLDASHFGYRGIGSWDYTEMTASAFSNAGVTFTKENVEITKGTEFKFNTGNYWKVTLDDAGKVKAETSLGQGLVPGADNIKVEEGGVMNVTLTFALKEGAIANSFSYEIKKVADLALDPSTFVVGLSGAGLENGWNDPSGSSKAEFKSYTPTDESKKAGTYVYEIATINIPTGTLKLRYNAAWIGVNQATVTGLEYDTTAADGADFNVSAGGQFKVTFTAEWDGEGLTSLKADFTKLGDLVLDPSTFVVGVSGSMWMDGTNDYGWNDPFVDVDGVTTKATFVSKNVTDNATLAGTYVWEIESLPITDGGDFKLRQGGDWVGIGGCTIEGLTVEGTDNIKVSDGQTGDYKVTLTIVWDGNARTSFTGKFEKIGGAAAAIAIDGNLDDWADIAAFAATSSSRIREWKFKSDAQNVYFCFKLRKNRAYNKPLAIGFDTDNNASTGDSYDNGKINGMEAQIEAYPFTNAASGVEPVAVNGVDGSSWAKAVGGTKTDGVVTVAAYDEGEDVGSDSSNTYIEISIPKSALNLPTGAITVGCAFDWYVTGTQSVTVE